MGASYSLILRACPEGSRDAVAQLLGRAFSLKDSTCVSIASSTPIVLLTDLAKDDAAALGLVMIGLEHKGATIELTADDVSELPKIDWPKRPLVFKRDIAEFASDFGALSLSLPGSNKAYTLQELLITRLDPQSRPSGHPARPSTEFKGAQLPEITPFSNQALSTPTPTPVPTHTPAPPRPSAPAQEGDAVSRLNELFPEEDSGFMPNNDDITSILDRLLPDEEQGKAQPGSGPVGHSSGSGRAPVASASGFSVFLAKIDRKSVV